MILEGLQYAEEPKMSHATKGNWQSGYVMDQIEKLSVQPEHPDCLFLHTEIILKNVVSKVS